MTTTGEHASVNVAARLADVAARMPDAMAVAEPRGRDRDGRIRYRQVSFAELEADSNRIASAIVRMGVPRGARLVLLVRPGIDFISLVFALLKAGVVAVLIDPGMGRSSLIRCLQDVEPEGFVAISMAQAVRTLLRRKFPRAKWNVTVGRRWFWGGPTLRQLRRQGDPRFDVATTGAKEPAAIIFTTGSTGPPKGVLYQHGNFDRQVVDLRDFYNIEPGEIDLPGFPLFGLFNCAMGVGTVIPEMDPTRPARVNPRNIIDAVRQCRVTQAFGSPALWNVVGQHCQRRQVTMPTLRRVLSAGAPVPPHVLQRMKAAIHPQGDVHTPYGATEALPVASISASEVLEETAERTAAGAGVCVGSRFPGICWKVIRICDHPLASMSEVEELPPGEIGELIVSGPVVTSQYVTRQEANAEHKIRDGDRFWHRMGDVGYFEPANDQRPERFWFCGRKSHRVRTAAGTLFSTPCEAVLNRHPQVYRTALVGVGAAGRQRPVFVVETWPEQRPRNAAAEQKLLGELQQLAASEPRTEQVRDILLHRSLPVDIRHNAKIFREKLADWAAKQLA